MLIVLHSWRHRPSFSYDSCTCVDTSSPACRVWAVGHHPRRSSALQNWRRITCHRWKRRCKCVRGRQTRQHVHHNLHQSCVPVATELATGVRVGALGWEHAVVLSAEDSVSSYAVPGAAGEYEDIGHSQAAPPEKTDLGILETVVAIAAGEQHRCSMVCASTH